MQMIGQSSAFHSEQSPTVPLSFVTGRTWGHRQCLSVTGKGGHKAPAGVSAAAIEPVVPETLAGGLLGGGLRASLWASHRA